MRLCKSRETAFGERAWPSSRTLISRFDFALARAAPLTPPLLCRNAGRRFDLIPAVGIFQRSGPLARPLDVQTRERAADQQEKQTRPTTNSDVSPGSQLAFNLLVDTVTPPGPDRQIGAAQNSVFVGSTKAHLALCARPF